MVVANIPVLNVTLASVFSFLFLLMMVLNALVLYRVPKKKKYILWMISNNLLVALVRAGLELSKIVLFLTGTLEARAASGFWYAYYPLFALLQLVGTLFMLFEVYKQVNKVTIFEKTKLLIKVFCVLLGLFCVGTSIVFAARPIAATSADLLIAYCSIYMIVLVFIGLFMLALGAVVMKVLHSVSDMPSTRQKKALIQIGVLLLVVEVSVVIFCATNIYVSINPTSARTNSYLVVGILSNIFTLISCLTFIVCFKPKKATPQPPKQLEQKDSELNVQE